MSQKHRVKTDEIRSEGATLLHYAFHFKFPHKVLLVKCLSIYTVRFYHQFRLMNWLSCNKIYILAMDYLCCLYLMRDGVVREKSKSSNSSFLFNKVVFYSFLLFLLNASSLIFVI